MLLPSIFGDCLFDDWMFPSTKELENMDRRLYGKHADRMMKTDVHEKDDSYEVDIELPGFKKEDLSLNLENGYLSVAAQRKLSEEEKNEKGKMIRCERYAGSMQRSFYVGSYVTEEDIKAKYEDGVLRLSIPKKEAPKVPEKKPIMIEG